MYELAELAEHSNTYYTFFRRKGEGGGGIIHLLPRQWRQSHTWLDRKKHPQGKKVLACGAICHRHSLVNSIGLCLLLFSRIFIFSDKMTFLPWRLFFHAWLYARRSIDAYTDWCDMKEDPLRQGHHWHPTWPNLSRSVDRHFWST